MTHLFDFILFSHSFDTIRRTLTGLSLVLSRGSFFFKEAEYVDPLANFKLSGNLPVSKDSFKRFCKTLAVTFELTVFLTFWEYAICG